MRFTTQRAAMALLALGVILASDVVTTATGQGCVPYNTSSSAGNLWAVEIAHPSYFRCADDGFIVGVESTSNSSVRPLDAFSWT